MDVTEQLKGHRKITTGFGPVMRLVFKWLIVVSKT
jgi:hypothetical protein